MAKGAKVGPWTSWRDFKFGGEPLPADERELARLRARLADRPVIVAASTHADEEGSILQAWRAADRSAGRKSLLVIVPRHPHRGAEIGRLAKDVGLSVGLRSEGADLSALDVHIADTIGELGLFFRLAALAFVGGSLVPGDLESLFAQAMSDPTAFAPMAARARRFVTKHDGEARAGMGRVLEFLGP